MPKPRRRERRSPVREANLIPVLSCMFLLIPALLLAMEIAPFSAIGVSSPQWTQDPTGENPPQDELKLSVMIRADGFVTTAAQAGANQPIKTEIPVLSEDTYDYDGLETYARTLKQLFPTQAMVAVTAEGDVPMKTLVNTMDALRGTDCSLAGAALGEEAPASCLFWQVTVEG